MAGTAALILPSCISDPKKVSIALNNLSVTGNDEELLALLAETLIPETDTPGARTVKAHLFTLVMVDDCMDTESKEKFVKGMKAFDENCKKISGTSFTDASPGERSSLVAQIEKGDGVAEDVKTFYHIARGYIISGYTSSEFFLTKIKPYQLIPGPHFQGCAPVSTNPA